MGGTSVSWLYCQRTGVAPSCPMTGHPRAGIGTGEPGRRRRSRSRRHHCFDYPRKTRKRGGNSASPLEQKNLLYQCIMGWRIQTLGSSETIPTRVVTSRIGPESLEIREPTAPSIPLCALVQRRTRVMAEAQTLFHFLSASPLRADLRFRRQ
jgi:hypothetical protein